MELADRLEERSYQFAVRVLRFCPDLPTTSEGYTIRGQLLRAALGTVANYRAARRARSRREFVACLGKTAEEADESALWTRLIIDGGVNGSEAAIWLRDEAAELQRVFGRSYGTARENLKREQATRAQRRQITKSPNHEITNSSKRP